MTRLPSRRFTCNLKHYFLWKICTTCFGKFICQFYLALKVLISEYIWYQLPVCFSKGGRQQFHMAFSVIFKGMCNYWQPEPQANSRPGYLVCFFIWYIPHVHCAITNMIYMSCDNGLVNVNNYPTPIDCGYFSTKCAFFDNVCPLPGPRNDHKQQSLAENTTTRSIAGRFEGLSASDFFQ